MSAPLELFTWPSPNGRRAAIMLEECALDHRVHWVDLTRGDQYHAAFLSLNPSATVPVLVDHAAGDPGPLVVRQSASILLHLADRTGLFCPTSSAERAAVVDALMLVMTDIAAAAVATFVAIRGSAEDGTIAIFRGRLRHFLEVAENQLSAQDYLAGNYSIADIALYPIVSLPVAEEALTAGMPLPSLLAWRERVRARPAVSRAFAQTPSFASGPHHG